MKELIINAVRWRQTTINSANSTSVKEPYAEGILRLVECDRKDARIFFSQAQQLLLHYDERLGIVKGLGKYLKPIITSNLETIQENDFMYYTETGEVLKSIKNFTSRIEGIEKIIVSSIEISQKFCDKVIDGMIKDGNTVQVELTEKNNGVSPTSWYIIKYNSNGEVTVHIPTAGKQSIVYDTMLGVGDGSGNHFVYGNYDTIKLLQEKLLKTEKQKYTIEDIRRVAFQAFVWHNRNSDNMIEMEILSASLKPFEKFFEDHIKI